MSEILSIRGLEKRFTLHNVDGRTVTGLRGIDLDVRAGEHVALAGSSGAGKSTLLKCVYRTYLPSAGSVVLHCSDGAVDLTALSDPQLARRRGRDVGYVSQFLRAEPRRGALDVVARAGVARGMPRDVALDAAARSLQRLNIDESLWDVYASVLSGGEKQRVNLAAGTISPPRLLLLDEPVSALDPANREAALGLIADLTAQGVAVLAVFHDLDAMYRLASRVVVLHDGRVADAGSPDTVLAQLEGVAR
ncbi:MAG: ATP-binding cassette domain-containing protein [Actinomycetota bacterium]